MNLFMAENLLQGDQILQQENLEADFDNMFQEEDRKIFETRSEKTRQLNLKRVKAPEPQPAALK